MNKNKHGEETTLNPECTYIYACFITSLLAFYVWVLFFLQGFKHLR